MKNLTAALEIIDYQNKDAFPEKMDKVIENIFKEIDTKIFIDNKDLLKKSSNVKDLINLLRERFNINIDVNVELSALSFAAIYLPFKEFCTDSSILNNLNIKNIVKIFSLSDYTKILITLKKLEKEKIEELKKLNNKKGYINLKYAKVDGYFKEIKFNLLLDFFTMKNLNLVPSEVTAIILHEVGHAFSVLENHYKLEKINLSMINIIDQLNENRVEEAEYTFKNYIATEDKFKKYLESKRTRSDLTKFVALSYLNKINSQIYNEKYLETVTESQADEFVVRFNRGKELVSALHKLDTASLNIYKNNFILSSIILFFEILFSGVIFFALGRYGVIIGLIFIILTMYNNKLDNLNMTYDFPLDRYNRVKNSIVNNLKNINLPEDLQKNLLEQYTFITQILEEFRNNRHIATIISEYIFFDSREAAYYMKLQQKIENNLNNNLFVSSAKLKTFETV